MAAIAAAPVIPPHAWTTYHHDLAKIQLQKPIVDNKESLYKVPLQELNCSFDVVTTLPEMQPLQHVVKQHAKHNHADVTIMYAIRQPSCPSCREHGLQLQEFAAHDRKLALVGAVKETGVADQEILAFYQRFFRNPIYKDPKWNVYKALGGHKISIRSTVLGIFRSMKRFHEKGIPLFHSGPAGESFLQGGILIFDKHGNLRYTYNEEFKEYDMDLVAAAVAETRRLAN